MNGPTGLLNFFALEAAEHVDQLDRLLGAAGDAGPDAEAVARAARGLRGAATMAKLTGIAALAAAVERTGRGLRERALPWTPTLRAALAAAVDDLRVLVPNAARAWSDDDEQRAQTRAAELLGFGPPAPRAASPTPISVSTGALFVVNGCTDVASALTAAADRPDGGALLADAVRRLRALRGVAAVKDFPPLPEVLDVLERAARPHAGRGEAGARVLETGAALLRRAAEDVRAGRRLDSAAAELAEFRAAATALESSRAEADRVVSITELYADGEASPVVFAAPAPGTSSADRFRLEAAAAGEHLRRLVAEARRVPDDADGTGDAAPLAAAARTLRDLARSFGHAALATAVERATTGVGARDPIALSAADAVAALFVSQRRTVDELARRVGELAGGRVLGALVAVGLAPLPQRRSTGASVEPEPAEVSAPTEPEAAAAIAPTIPAPPTPSPVPHEPDIEPEPEPMPVPMPEPTPIEVPAPEPEPWREPAPEPESEPVAAGSATRPTGRDLHALLESGIAGITRLRDERGVATPGTASAVRPPTPAASDVVPVDALLYRGRAALGRAIELRDEIRRAPGPPPVEKLDELFDLLDLAAHG